MFIFAALLLRVKGEMGRGEMGRSRLTKLSLGVSRHHTQSAFSGSNLLPATAVTFNGIPAAAFTVNSATSITATVSSAATTGPISVLTAGGTATSAGSFVVLALQDLQLTVQPAMLVVPAAGQAAFSVSLTGCGGVTTLATLAVTGVPSGTTVLLGAPTLTAGQTTQLTVATTGNTSAGSYPLTVRATALLNGAIAVRSAQVTLQVQAPGVTSLAGQVLDEDARPLQGALIKLGTLQATTDAAGNFLLLNPPAGPDQLLLIDGGPASTPGRSFPIIPYKVTIVAGQANSLGFTPHLHFQKTTGLVDVSQPAAPRVVTDPGVPGFQMTIPAGVTITGWDGQPNTQVSIRPVPVDRSPLPPFPSGITTALIYMDYFGKPGGGTPSAPVPITCQ